MRRKTHGAGLLAFALWGELLAFKTFLLLTVGSLLLNLLVSGIAYFAACTFHSAGASTSLGTGLPLAFFLLYVAATFFGSNELLGMCKYFTIHSLYSPADIIACNSSMALQFAVMGIAAAADRRASCFAVPWLCGKNMPGPTNSNIFLTKIK